MRIFRAGGTDVLDTRRIPELTAAGHQATATTRRPDRTGLLTGSRTEQAWNAGPGRHAMDHGCAGNLQPRRGRLAV